jgi:molybdenum cofactor cytidylyltransferase
MTAVNSVAGILLAAGTASRMGSNKLLFELGEETLLHRAARRALEAGLDPLIVVLGHRSDENAAALEGVPCLKVINPDYEQGINTSLKTGVAALPDEAQAVVVMLADMPYVSPEMLDGLVERYRASGAPLVISDYEGVHAPPMLYDRSLFPELLAMTGEGCGRQVVKRHRGEAEVLAWPASALTDLDIPEDWDRIVRDAG